MANPTIHTAEELKKMNVQDRMQVLSETTRALEIKKMHLRMGEDKKSHELNALKVQVARIQTINNQA